MIFLLSILGRMKTLFFLALVLPLIMGASVRHKVRLFLSIHPLFFFISPLRSSPTTCGVFEQITS